MQWDDLKVILALVRGGSRARAAQLLGVDKTTISRRLEALERDLGTALVERQASGRFVPTAQGRQIAVLAERMEDQARAIRAACDNRPAQIEGWVRVTAVPLVVNHLLLPALPAFQRRHPGIGLELLSEARDLSLGQGDADIALRLARPRDGGQAVLTRQIGQLRYAAYAAAGTSGPLPWIGYDRSMHYLTHAAAIAQVAQASGQSLSSVAVNDAETLFQAVQAGLGQSLFPREIADRHPGLRQVPCDVPLPAREVWLMVRRDLRALQRVDAVVRWLEAGFKTRSDPRPDAPAGSPAQS